MDAFEIAKVVVQDRVLKFESQEIATKVLGYLLIHYQKEEIIRFSLGPDILIQKLISEAKIVALQLSNSPIVCPPILPSVNPTSIPRSRSLPPRLVEARHREYRQGELMGLEDRFEPFDSVASGFRSCFCNEGGVNNISLRHNQNMPNAPEIPVKMCHDFNKGFCMHGRKCLYFHGQSPPSNYSQMFGPNSHEFGYKDQVFTPRSLERLEMEIAELLKCRGGRPLSIASLPLLYLERYGKALLGEGYLAETQRHDKSEIKLTKVLAQLNTTIRLIDWPDGHAIILAEGAAKNLEVRAERNYPDPIVTHSRLYLTFKAECTFTKEDVSNYFSTFGPVQEVRIPLQDKRMFGFVFFASEDTVTTILSKENPHYICGDCVFVKPYVPKSEIYARKYNKKLDPSMYSSHHMDIISEHQQSRIHRELIEEHKKVLEIKLRRMSNLSLSQSLNSNQSYFDRSIQESGVSQDRNKFPSAEQFRCMLNSGHTTDSHLAEIDHTDPDRSQEFNLPDNPFE